MTRTTADLVDQITDIQSCDLQFRDFGAHRDFGGVVETIKCYEDNLLIKRILSTNGAGKVLIVDGGGSLHTALMGDVIAGLGVQNGWVGVVINGAIRDSAAIAGLPLGVKALGTNPRKSAITGAGEHNVPISFGGVTFNPGDKIYCDADGIVVY